MKSIKRIDKGNKKISNLTETSFVLVGTSVWDVTVSWNLNGHLEPQMMVINGYDWQWFSQTIFAVWFDFRCLILFRRNKAQKIARVQAKLLLGHRKQKIPFCRSQASDGELKGTTSDDIKYNTILFTDSSPQGAFQWQFTILEEIKSTEL